MTIESVLTQNTEHNTIKLALHANPHNMNTQEMFLKLEKAFNEKTKNAGTCETCDQRRELLKSMEEEEQEGGVDPTRRFRMGMELMKSSVVAHRNYLLSMAK